MKPAHGRSRFVGPAILAALLALAAPVASAQSGDRPLTDDLDELPGRIEQALRGLLDQMKPVINDATDLMDVLGEIDSPKNYEKPVILPNGDILIRRSPDAPDWDPEVEDLDDGPRLPDLDPDGGTPI